MKCDSWCTSKTCTSFRCDGWLRPQIYDNLMTTERVITVETNCQSWTVGFIMNGSQVIKFLKSETDSTVLSSHNDSICTVNFIYLPKQHGDWRVATHRVNIMKSTITFLWFYLLFLIFRVNLFPKNSIFFVILNVVSLSHALSREKKKYRTGKSRRH
jgi:hypothetical protein